MSSYHGKTLPPITDDKKFEHFVADLWTLLNPGSSNTLMGRSGQGQNGIDVFVSTASGKFLGLQCKATARMTEEMLTAEVSKAQRHDPPVDRFILATTAKHDANLVSFAQRLTKKNGESGLFPVEIYGWSELLRLSDPYPELIHRYFPEFGLPQKQGQPSMSLPVGRDRVIPLDDVELALFCSEAASALKRNPDTKIRVCHPDEEDLIREIEVINMVKSPTVEERARRSDLEAVLSAISPRLRRLEAAIPLLLVNDTIRSPWLLGPDWRGSALALRRLCADTIRHPMDRKKDVLTLKMRSTTNSAILAYLDLEGDDRSQFLSKNPSFSPQYFLGHVPDLGSDLGLKYALPAGIEALLRYSANFEVPMEDLRKAGEFSIYAWMIEPS